MFQPPKPLNMGSPHSGVIDALIAQKRAFEQGDPVIEAERYVMGFPVPKWQRKPCWTRGQDIKFIESIYLGIPIGFYMINAFDIEDNQLLPFSDILNDGQNRLMAIEAYLNNEFEVYGAYWKNVPQASQRRFRRTHFPYYETNMRSEADLRDLFNRLNFAGVAHSEDERA